ncbi:hypothetical protein [Planctomicrobium piriforme]|uniref:Uncharacterized protein n=1 Tax=Planctomicrobium piriforme TaxID=1576369 RepID=A0A1I3RPR1_9PLAN|nr:hypothetical protein [Planctomicrobium piriforme]SFJ48040.1 hypothetical protein SAMN05421753_12173 [Planctomicrobium piriforme]
MKFQVKFGSVLAMAVAVGTMDVSRAEAGCPCQKGGDSYGGTLSPIPMSSSPMMMNAMPSAVAPLPGIAGYPTVPATGVPGVGPGYSGATATTWQPPPGTIGRTYQMKSRPVPVKMHPRAAIVDVHVPDAKSVRVHDMNVYRTQDYLEGFQDHEHPDMWHFTSEPLIPGLPHIYRIEARFDGPNGERMEERYVRLIMGRVIEVEMDDDRNVH